MSKNKALNDQNHGVGRRKSSVARVWLKPGAGSLVINGKDYQEYFGTAAARMAAVLPVQAIQAENKFDIKALVNGGGVTGQADAVALGIARALLDFDENLRATLREYGLLTVDSRIKERKKYGQRGARRRFQFVKR